MLEVPDVQCIRVMVQRGLSVRQIARELHVSRKTVRKYGDPDYVVRAEPRQRIKKARPAPQMDRWKPILASWVAQDDGEPRKQRRTARRMHELLQEIHHANVSEAAVRRYVAHVRGARAREAYVPLEFIPGSMMQVDFGHAEVMLAGVRQMLPFIALRLMASTVSFAKMFAHEQLESWMDGVASALSFFGGVPREGMFDNASPLVNKILAGGRRLQSPEFRALMAHYGFEAVFCNPGRGNEKGGVESLVRWAQRNLFSPVPEAAALAELNERLVQQCLRDAERRVRGGRPVSEAWDAERRVLGQLPGVPFPACRHRFVRVDKTLLVSYDNVRYSVPAGYAQKALMLRAFWDRIEIADRQRTVAVHERRASGQPPSLQLEHYLPVLAHKPRAVRHAAVVAHGAPEIARYRDEFLGARPEAAREMVDILRLHTDVGPAALAQALSVASRHHAYDIESVRAILAMDGEAPAQGSLPEALLQRWPDASVRAVDSAAYGWLTEVAAGSEAP